MTDSPSDGIELSTNEPAGESGRLDPPSPRRGRGSPRRQRREPHESTDRVVDLYEAARCSVPSIGTIAALPAKELPSLVLALAAAQSAVAARLAVTAVQPRDDAYLSVDDVAGQLGVDPAWVYRQAARWPFAVKLSSKVVRIERAGLRRWLEQRRRR